MWNYRPRWEPGTNQFLLILVFLRVNHRYLHSWGWDSQHCHGGSCPGGLHWWLACKRGNHSLKTSHRHTCSQNPCAETDFNSKSTFLGHKEGLILNFRLHRQNKSCFTLYRFITESTAVKHGQNLLNLNTQSLNPPSHKLFILPFRLQPNPAVQKEILRALSIYRYLQNHKLTNTSQPSFGDPTPRTAEPSTF